MFEIAALLVLMQVVAVPPAEAEPEAPPAPALPEIVGWSDPMRVELRTPIGPLPFVVEIGRHAVDADAPIREYMQGYYSAARVVNGKDTVIRRDVHVHATGYVAHEYRDTARSYARIVFPGSGSVLQGSRGPSCVMGNPIADYMPLGLWKTEADGVARQMSLTSKRADSEHDRFDVMRNAGPTAPFEGAWVVRLEASEQQGAGLLTLDGRRAIALLITPDGSLRDFGGRVDGDLLRLSYFDGRHAYLIHARLQQDGSLRGEFWEGDWHHEVWTAVRDETIP
jgi:hypothetical protein